MQETTTQIGRRAAILVVAILSLAFLFAPAFPMLASHAAGTITVTTDKTSYSANATYVVSGTVSGANATGTAVSIVVTNSLNQVADQNIANVINGAYTVTLHAGGSAAWTTGTYTVTASWAPGVGSSVSSTTTFTYTAAVGTTSSGGGGGGTTTIINSNIGDYYSSLINRTISYHSEQPWNYRSYHSEQPWNDSGFHSQQCYNSVCRRHNSDPWWDNCQQHYNCIQLK